MRQESSFLTADVQDGHINELTCFYKCLLPGALHREGSVTESELSPGEGSKRWGAAPLAWRAVPGSRLRPWGVLWA